tara:strand:- start:4228 stop:6423 length:2196 start_codon:yes stop_codon:yes gene_type:complete
MWLPMLLGDATYKNMVQCGVRLTPEQIYSANNSSLKDAIVALGGGFCTGEIISDQGLMLTNHHCGFGTIQANSNTDHDYLTDGFWAMNKSEEIPADFGVWFLDKIVDVTDKVLDGVTDGMSEDERNKLIGKNMAFIKKKYSEGAGDDFKVQVKSFYYGNLYYLFTYNVFNDVRLVGAPPSSIGKFGGDTDNWMWPRHTGDFTMFRIYANKDNKPAEYAEDNIPYSPKHSLPVSIAGIEEGDYAMIMGYPGSTDRYLTSWGVQKAVDIEQPARVKIRRIKLDIMEAEMEKSQKVRIQYASKHASVSNYWKYFLGQSQQLVKNNVVQKKQKIENDFSNWYKSNKLESTYGQALELVKESEKNTEKYTLPGVYFQEAIFGSEVLAFVVRNLSERSKIYQALSSGSEDDIKQAKASLLASAKDYYKDYNAVVDENTLAAVLDLYYNDVPKEFHPEALSNLGGKYKGDFKAFSTKYFSKTPFSSYESFEAWVEKGISKKYLDKDPVFQLQKDFITLYRNKIMMPQSAMESDFNRGMRLFVDGLQKMGMNKASDANSTMRFTYGNILSYSPANAIHYDYITTLKGVMEKEVNTEDKNHEFYVPQRLKDLYEAEDFGPYARKSDGQLPVGFLSNNDITGGNSGSPVINAHGELIGTAFDGNWEAMSGDIYFEPNIQRTISVDIRYTLFIIDKYAGAKHLIDEMNLVTERHDDKSSPNLMRAIPPAIGKEKNSNNDEQK